MLKSGITDMFGNCSKLFVVFIITCFFGFDVSALEPDDILIIANGEVPESVMLAETYCKRRLVPENNILKLSLGAALSDTITRDDYEARLAGPIRNQLRQRRLIRPIRCLLTTYGVPFKVAGRGRLLDRKDKISLLREQQAGLKQRKQTLEQQGVSKSSEDVQNIDKTIILLQSQIDLILGKETSASVDSELSMVAFNKYELFRWQHNRLKNKSKYWDFKTLMVSRLDGPSLNTAKSLIDRSMAAEKNGLQGIAYIDSGYSIKMQQPIRKDYDRSLRDLALLIKTQTQLSVVEERSFELFKEGQCPSAALYCGWYSLQKYVDAFDFVDGAIGYHIASLEAVNLRDPNSSQWCPAMLRDGITATIGAVAEPYLHTIPRPDEFFTELLNGYCLVEAYYRTKPFNSWQLVLIGDPLYMPFKKHRSYPEKSFFENPVEPEG